jgi:sugar phosphate isomerase/epimerase
MQTRRKFIATSATLAIGSVLLADSGEAGKRVKNVGVQLYTFRNELLKDAKGTLKQIASLGIKQIESASSEKGHYYGLTAKEMKATCDELGMTLRSGHVHLDKQWEQTMNEAVESGQEYLIVASMTTDGQTVDNYKKVAEAFNKAGDQCRQLNLKFGYHNHMYEFETDNGQVLYDVLLDNTDPDLVHMELDLGWALAAGKNPLNYFKNHKGRFPLWHLKDMDLAKKSSTEFGKGSLPISGILKHSREAGMKYFFVEQEEYTNGPLLSMEYNMEYLKRLRY